jgi:hypothetical protein
LISASELQMLQAFDSCGRITLSAYLCLEDGDVEQNVYEEFIRQAETCMEQCSPKPECREAIKEDMEIVGLYLKTNGHRRYPGLAIFSCAAELFWRAFPLPVSIASQVQVGPRFHLEPLTRAVGAESIQQRG